MKRREYIRVLIRCIVRLLKGRKLSDIYDYMYEYLNIVYIGLDSEENSFLRKI